MVTERGQTDGISPRDRHGDVSKREKHWLDRLTFIIVVFTFLAAVGSLYLAWSTQQTTLQAYVYATIPSITKPNDNYKIKIDIVNSGQTPAYKTDITIRWNVSTNKSDFVTANFKNDEANHINIGLLNKDVKITREPRFSNGFTIKLQDLDDPRMNLYLFGEINYKDVYRRERFTRFCFEGNKKNVEIDALVACSEYNNDTDSGP